MEKLIALLKSELLTKLNVLATVILMWIINQPGAPTEQVLEYLPASWHGIVTIAAPLLWAVVVQFAIKELKDREPVEPAEEPAADAPVEAA